MDNCKNCGGEIERVPGGQIGAFAPYVCKGCGVRINHNLRAGTLEKIVYDPTTRIVKTEPV
jgi:DNA-directed RNA polymerase subunit RPC12/RpoP